MINSPCMHHPAIIYNDQILPFLHLLILPTTPHLEAAAADFPHFFYFKVKCTDMEVHPFKPCNFDNGHTRQLPPLSRYRTFSSPKKIPLSPFSINLCPRGNYCFDVFHLRLVLLVLESHKNGII